VLLEKMDIVRGMMHGCDYSGLETEAVGWRWGFLPLFAFSSLAGGFRRQAHPE